MFNSPSKNFFFTPLAIGLFCLAIVLGAIFPLEVLFLYLSIAVYLIVNLKVAIIAPLILAFFPRLWHDPTFAVHAIAVSIGVSLLFFCLNHLRKSGWFKNQLFFLLGIIACFLFSIYMLVQYPDIRVDRWLVDGRSIEVDRLPWYYFLHWLSITTPIFLLITTLLGIVEGWIQYRKINSTQKYLYLYTLSQFVFLLIISCLYPRIALNFAYLFLMIYNMAILSSIGLIWFLTSLQNKHLRILAISFIIIQLLPVFFDSVALYPYQNLYFNRTYGGLSFAYQHQQIELEDASFREAIDWLNQNSHSYSTIVVAKNIQTNKEFKKLKPDLQIINSNDVTHPKSYFSLETLSNKNSPAFSHCSVVYSLVRQKTPLISIKKCQN